jgi:hypothetical protein
MMHGREKSDLAIVAMKPANKANEPTAEASTGANAAEPVERRAGAKGNAHQQSTHWTQSQARVSQALERIRQAIAVIHPRWEPYAGKPPVRFCAGGAMKIASLPLQYHPPRPIVVALTLQSEFHETIASLVSAIACRNVWPSKEIGPTWAPEIAPVSVSKNPPQAVRTILLKQRSIHRSPQPSWRSFTQSGRWVTGLSALTTA